MWRSPELLPLAGFATLFFFPGAHPSPEPRLGSLVELVDADGGRLPRLEASGIAYFRGQLIVVDDTVNSLFVFDRRGRLRKRIEPAHFPRAGAKFEDLAVDEPSATFLAVGSHSGLDPDSFEAHSVLLRFRLSGVAEELVVDEPAVDHLPLYRSFERQGLWRPGGMKIEGLALDSSAGEIYVGLREPLDRARIYRLSLARLEEAGRGGEPAPIEEVFSFDAGMAEGTPFAVSALTWVPQRGGLLIATSTEEETTHRFLGNRLWFVSPGGEVELLQDIFDPGMKAEGLAVGEGSLFISYDNDQDDTGVPSRLRVLPLADLFKGR